VDDLSEPVRTALAPILRATERVDRVMPAVGCSLVLTDRQLLLVREGANFRPRSGVQSWPLDRDLQVRLIKGRGGASRLVIAGPLRSASAFLTAEQAGDALALVEDIQQRAYGEG
jgi:hypothetical protein